MALVNLDIDKTALEENGYTFLRKLVCREHLAKFETTIERFSALELKRWGVQRAHKDRLHDLMLFEEGYRQALFPMLRYLGIVQSISVEVGNRLSDFLEISGFQSPLIWPVLRVDLPNEDSYLLPMHQDYQSTKCSRALRLWIPLRDADGSKGTMRLIPGSHHRGPLPHDIKDERMFGPALSQALYAGEDELVVELKAGDGLLFDPLLIHGSVRSRSDLLKFVLLVQIQDLSTFIYDPPGQPTRFSLPRHP